jgi:hypothetical protein
VLALALLSALAASVFAQPGSEDPGTGETVLGDPSQYDDPVDTGDEGDAAPEADLVLAQPPYTMNYQGYLTNAAGAPFHGTVNMVAALWDASSGGTREWGPETHTGVVVNNGLFQLVLGSTVTLEPNDFDEALYLELTVGATVMPRQPLRASAYAFGLVPGAEVQGVPAASDYALSVDNTSDAADGRGLYAAGSQYGLYVVETGDGDTAIYSPDFVQARGYRSNDDSYVFVPGVAGAISQWSATPSASYFAENTGYMYVKALAPVGFRTFVLPITIPAVLYGQNVTVEEVRLYYWVDNAASFISRVTLEKSLYDGSSQTIASDDTDLKSTIPTSRSYTPTAGTLDSTSGALTLRVQMSFANTSDSVVIMGARLRLGHK